MNFSIWKRVFQEQYGPPVGLFILTEGMLWAFINSLTSTVISEDIGLDKSQVILFLVISVLLGAVTTLATGYLSDSTWSRSSLVIACSGIAALGYLGLAVATQPLHAFLVCPLIIMVGVLFPQFFAVAKVGVVAEWSREDQVMGITVLRTVFSLGYVFGTGIASLVAHWMKLQDTFFVVAGILLFLALYAGAVIRSVERSVANRVQIPTQLSDKQTVQVQAIALPIGVMVMPILSLLVLKGADSTRGAFLPLVMLDMFDDASIAPLMFGITAAAELVTMSMIGTLASRTNEKTAIAWGAATGVFYFLVMAFSQSLPVLYTIQLLNAFFIAALLGVAMAYVQRLLADRVGMGSSLYIAIMNIGSLIGILAPLLVEGYDQKIFIIPAVLCLVGVVILVWGDRTEEAQLALAKP